MDETLTPNEEIVIRTIKILTDGGLDATPERIAKISGVEPEQVDIALDGLVSIGFIGEQ